MPTNILSACSYAAVSIGTFVEGEAVLLSAGALAHAGFLSLPLVVLAAALGSFAWGQSWFRFGSVSGRALIARRPAWQARVAVVERWLAHHEGWLLLFGRFIFGMGTLLPAAVGASGYAWRRFVVIDSIGALIWATTFACAGFAGAAGVRLWLGHPVAWSSFVVAAGALVVVFWFLIQAFMARHRRRSAPPDNSPQGKGRMSSSKRVIITGDDFGLALPVNEAIEVAFREGVLSSTSLLVGEPAAGDAILRARRNPALCVGLHLAVCDGRPLLPTKDIPLLVNTRGELRSPMRALVQLLLLGWLPALQAQLEAEIRAQFEAFRRAGLRCDHVDGHNNMQLHPVVLPILIRVAREYGVTAVRVPFEPLIASWRAGRCGFFLRSLVWLVMYPWSAYVRRRLRRAGFVVNDFLFGIFDCGSMDRTLLRRVIERLPEGLSEIHCHPATRRCAELDKNMPSYGHEAELAALTDPDVRYALDACGVQRIAGYGAVLARDSRA